MDQAANRRAGVAAAAAAMALMAAVVPAVVADAGRDLRRVEGVSLARPFAATPSTGTAAGLAPAPAPPDPVELARRAVQRGLLELATAPDVWNRVESGDAPPGLRFDEVYRDAELPGSYMVSLSSGPLFGQVTVTGVARAGGEVRALRAVYDYFPRPPLREAACVWDEQTPRCP